MSGARIIARGTIRVDARKAAAKLREHLLVDLHCYTLEIARAASALGAERLEVTWDADDVVLAFDGAPIERQRLERLLDFALVESKDESERALRTLALGVNAAIGLGARQVSVTSCADGRAWRVSLERAALDRAEAGNAFRSRADDAPPPAGSFPRGVCVSVHRGLGLEVVKRALLGGAPREVALLVEATHGSELDLRVNGSPVVRAARPRALARARLDLPEARYARVEVLPAGASSSFELSERGVRLLQSSWTPWPAAGRQLPLRLVVDADEVPTNASRSALREDSPLGLALGPAAEQATRRALDGLVARVLGQGELPEFFEVVEPEIEPLENALGALASAAAAVARSGNTPSEELSRLLALPLLHGVGGRRISVGSLLLARSVYVWRSAEPLPEELAPWLGGVVWLRGLEVERVLEGLQLVDAGELLKLARIGAGRRKELLARPAVEPKVPQSAAELARQRFSFAESPFAGLEGEVVLLAPIGEKPRPSLLRLFVEQRLIEAIAVDPGTLPLAIDAALAWPGFLRPRFDYAGVEKSAELTRAIYAVVSVAIGMANAGAAQLAGLPPEQRSAFASVLRGAIVAYALVPKRLGFPPRELGAFEREYGNLHRAQVLPTPNPRHNLSVHELSRYAETTGVLEVARAWQAAPSVDAPDGRPVLAAGSEDAEAIRDVLSVAATITSYDAGSQGRMLDAPAERRAVLAAAVVDERVRQTARASAPTLVVEEANFVAVAAPGYEARVIEAHRGVVLQVKPHKRSSLPLIIAYDDRRTVPTSNWDAAAWVPARFHAAILSTFLGTVVSALEGDLAAREKLGPGCDGSADASLTALLISAASSLEQRAQAAKRAVAKAKFEAMARRIEALPLLTWCDPDGALKPVSLAEIEKQHGENPPLLSDPPDFATLDWWPVVVSTEPVRQALARRGAREAGAELAERRDKAQALGARRSLLARAPADVSDLSALVAPDDRVVRLHGEGNLAVHVGLPRPDLDFATPWVVIHFQGRPVSGLAFGELPAPVAGTVDVRSDADLVGWSTPSALGLSRIRMRLTEAAATLARELLDDASGPGASGKLLSDHRALNLFAALMRDGSASLLEARLLGGSFLWPTVQGGEVELRDLQMNDNKLWVGHERYAKWERHPSRESDLDRPILYAPLDSSANALASVLRALGFDFLDVTGAVAKVQAERRGGAALPPRLGGVAAHASLRADLGSLGFGLGDGELELFDGSRSTASVLLLDGTRRELELELACPVRAVVRAEGVDVAALEKSLGDALESAAENLLERIAPELGRLPAFARRTARALVLREVAAAREPRAELMAAPVFEDTAGRWHALQELVAARRWTHTTLPPPFPPLPLASLLLTPPEADALRSLVELTLADEVVMRAARAEQRRNAPPLPKIELTPEEQNACVVTAPFAAGTASGELGVLVPRAVERRGIRLHVGRRPLGPLDDAPGWPLVASINDDALAPDDWFERPNDDRAASALLGAVRAAAKLALERVFAPPPTAIAARWLEDVSVGDLRVTGALWLPGSLPRMPEVRVYTAERAAPFARSLVVAIERPVLSPALPVEGDLLVRRTSDENSTLDPALLERWCFDALGKLGAEIALTLCADAAKSGHAPPVLDEHVWNLALLGLGVEPPSARASDGKRVGPHEIVRELAERGAIWLGDGRGFVEGEFPAQMPSFVLDESESRLVSVLELRALPNAVRRLGGVAPAALAPEPPESARAPLEIRPQSAAEGPVWQGLRERLADFWGKSEPVSAPHPGLAALERLLTSLTLFGDPIARVAAARMRRPVRYDAASRSLLVAQSHPAVAPLLARAASDPRAVTLLAAAALSELNRALTEVTDAEERRALATLLEEL